MAENDVTPETSAKITNLAFVFALFVVAGHIGWIADGAFGRAMATMWIRCFARIVVPFYFAVSGFFLAAHFNEEGWWPKALRRRARTLLLPYLFWLTVYALTMLALTGKWVVGLGGYGFNLCRQPMVGALWYVRCLMIFVLVSPLLKGAVERWGAYWLVAAYGANVVVAWLTGSGILAFEAGLGGLLGYGISIEGVVYFSLGIWLRHHRQSIGFAYATTAFLVGFALVAALIALESNGMSLPLHQSVLISPFLLLGCWHFAPTAHWPKAITSCAFPIYLVHGIVLSSVWARGLPRDAIGQWVALAAGILVPMLIHLGLSWKFPRACAFVFGGR